MKKALMLVGFVVTCALVFAAYNMSQPKSDGPDLATTRNTAEQQFSVSITPENEGFEYNSLHNWIVTVLDSEGTPVENASIEIDGRMPAHKHGLPTSPQVTEYLGEGRYKIEGVQFHMQGLWELNLSIDNGSASDTVTFNLMF